jgi:uncharacterized protein (TIGR02145 family)
MSDLKINNITPLSGNIKVGNTNVSQIYCGSTLIWPLAPPITPCNLPNVVIGTQTWKGCNLNVSTYANGDPIPQAIDDADWFSKGNDGIGAWCHYDNDPANDAIYGKLYNWHAVNNISNGGLAPAGYHIPTDAEWTTLTTYLGGESVAGGKMKSTGTIQAGTGLWEEAVQIASNSSGFTGLPGGRREEDGAFFDIGYYGLWWSLTEDGTFYANFRMLQYNVQTAISASQQKEWGMSVRLIENN